MQVVVITSEKYYHCLPPFLYLWNKYFGWSDVDMVVCGFTPQPDLAPYGDHFHYYSLGQQSDFPVNRWSEKLYLILGLVANEQFILMLEDYWLVRPVDIRAVRMLFDYAKQFQNILKIDLTYDRLYINGGSNFLYAANTYDNCGYLDLIKSPPGTPYQMSLWGGIWNRDQLRKLVVEGETPQELELNGTGRVKDDQLVFGTRQAPMLHGNIYQSRHNGKAVYSDGGWAIKKSDLEYMRKKGWIE